VRGSLPGGHGESENSGHGKEANERGTLTSWRAQREGQVRKRKQASQGHSLPGEHKGRDKLEYGRTSERRALTP
jgi:hypothetical protein